MKPVSALVSAILLATSAAATAGEASRASFGTTPDGKDVTVVTLTNGKGMTAKVLSLGAALYALDVPDRNGKPGDIVLGYPDLKGTFDNPQYFGNTVGRYANRIARGKFTLDGKQYSVPVNNGPNSLHGGKVGFDKVIWTVDKVESGATPSVTLTYVSPDGDQGYPGKLTATAKYSLNDKNELTIEYTATTDAPTIVNITNHTYWNLSGEGSGSVMDQVLMIAGDAYLPTDATAIPLGEVRNVAGTDFDFRKAKPIGKDIRDSKEQQLVFGRGYDHNWVISRKEAAQPREVARVTDPKSGRVLSLWSAQPGLQFYSGNFLDATSSGKSGGIYRQGDAFALEPQIFPDTPNHPDFGSARLEPGKTYKNTMTYKFTTTK
ncbi:MAG: aldose epimerase family protein [Luteibacter sp.]|uniref:aldose epimerase family protein n=1 Tax=Luteibacter TaxID=242605 RepID=UPI000560153F|nr:MULTISPECIES: aldose epimerase family protein [unclassified Luteibacter]MDQ7997504.1 aldose epimerase family protein [Luteibacter sp.]MDQ8050032.1 aldose epimerase family protein [Luteibacter sp.]